MLQYAFQYYLTCAIFVRGCHSTVVNFILAQVIYYYLHRLVNNRVWASEQIKFISIVFNASIKNSSTVTCLTFQVFNHKKMFGTLL